MERLNDFRPVGRRSAAAWPMPVLQLPLGGFRPPVARFITDADRDGPLAERLSAGPASVYWEMRTKHQ